MKPKPKIGKNADGWSVERPGYGFGPPVTLGPFPSHGAALAALRTGTGSAGSSVERTVTPEAVSAVHVWWHGSRTWQPVIR